MTLKMSKNRLSGLTPASGKYMTDINVLKGNRFACDENIKNDENRTARRVGVDMDFLWSHGDL